MIHALFNWFEHAVGMTNGAGPEYLFWSGIGSDLQEITLLGAVLGIYYKHNCHAKGCLKLGKHSYAGTPYCTKHHPEMN